MEVVNHAATCPCIVEELEQFRFPFQTGKSTLYRKKVKEILSHNLSEELIQKLIDSLKNSRAIENFEEYQLADMNHLILQAQLKVLKSDDALLLLSGKLTTDTDPFRNEFMVHSMLHGLMRST